MPFDLGPLVVPITDCITLGSIDAVFYCWFEAFPLTFSGVYGFSLGVAGLPYLGFFVSGVITVRLARST